MRARTRPLKDFCLVIWCSSARGGSGTHAPVAPREGTRPASREPEVPFTFAGRWREHREEGRARDGAGADYSPWSRRPEPSVHRPLGRVTQPQGGPRRLHGLVDPLEELGAQGVRVDLVAQPGRERLDGPGGVVA